MNDYIPISEMCKILNCCRQKVLAVIPDKKYVGHRLYVSTKFLKDNNINLGEKLLKPLDVSEWIGYSVQGLATLSINKILLVNAVRYRASDVESWLQQKLVAPASQNLKNIGAEQALEYFLNTPGEWLMDGVKRISDVLTPAEIEALRQLIDYSREEPMTRAVLLMLIAGFVPGKKIAHRARQAQSVYIAKQKKKTEKKVQKELTIESINEEE